MNEKGSDIKFNIQGKIIPAHKKVLKEKSPYFEDFFESNFPRSFLNNQIYKVALLNPSKKSLK